MYRLCNICLPFLALSAFQAQHVLCHGCEWQIHTSHMIGMLYMSDGCTRCQIFSIRWTVAFFINGTAHGLYNPMLKMARCDPQIGCMPYPLAPCSHAGILAFQLQA